MAMLPLDEKVVEQRQAELKEELLPASDVVRANQEALAILSTVRRFELPEGSGKWFVVDRVPYYEGTQLYDIYLRLREADRFPEHAKIGIFDKMLDEVIDIAWFKLIRPESRSTRLRKFLFPRWNPLRKLSEGEVSSLLSFFLVRRKTSSVHFESPASQGQGK